VSTSIGAAVRLVPPDLAAVFTMDSPSWTRLEPQSVSGDPSPGTEARIADPYWLLGRQAQFGEFQGEDVGSPVSVHVNWTSTPVDAWRPAGGAFRPLDPGDLLEPLVESEPAAEPGLRGRFEAGAQFLTMLDDAGFAVRSAVLAACPLLVVPALAVDGVPPYDPAADPFDADGPRLVSLFADRLPDAERIAAALTHGTPAWLPAAASAVAREWLEWYRGRPGPSCWADERLEYSFELTAGPHTLTAPEFGGGRVDWYDFAHASSSGPPGGTTTTMGPVLATPLSFPGRADPRYWAFEDAEVSFAAIEAKPYDLARLAFTEFALVYGQDWLVVPIDVPVGSLTVINELTYTDTFGEHVTVPRAADGFQLFQVDGLPGLLVPPATPGALEGTALEEVHLLRDEAANLGWAVEQTVRAASGTPRSRADEPVAAPPPAGTEPGVELDYVLRRPLPARWIPLVPVATGPGVVALRKGALSDEPPRGVLLEGPLTIEDSRVPREGVRLSRVPALARRPDGRYARWIRRRATSGRGEGTSHLAFDAAIPRR
jgi:hypothetical protein